VNSFSDAKLHVFDFDGNELWHIDTPDTIGHYASPAVSGGRIFFAGGDPALYCVDVSDRSTLWKFNTSDALKTTPAIEDGMIFFATESKMYAVDMAGSEVWNHSLKATISSPAVAHGKVYIGSSFSMKKLYCLDARSGSEIWNKSVNGAILSSPAVAQYTVYFRVNSGDGTIYALNATDGTVRWSYDTDNYVMSPPSISDGTMFIGSDRVSVRVRHP
jgi:cobaltochelatase CobN